MQTLTMVKVSRQVLGRRGWARTGQSRRKVKSQHLLDICTPHTFLLTRLRGGPWRSGPGTQQQPRALSPVHPWV